MKELLNNPIYLIQSGFNMPIALILSKAIMAAVLTLAFQYWKPNLMETNKDSG
jgi:hypothetical protein